MTLIHNLLSRRAVLGGIAFASTGAATVAASPPPATEPLVEPIYHMVMGKWRENAAHAELGDGQEAYVVLRDLARAMAAIPSEGPRGIEFKQEVAALRWERGWYTLSLDFDTTERLHRSVEADSARLGIS